MKGSRHQAFGLKAMIVFYLVGTVAVLFTLLSNDRHATGAQLASVHGMPWLPAVAAILLTALLGTLVVVAMNSARPWGFWVVMGYMAFLLVYPPWVLGPSRVSLFANVAWPLFVVAYLAIKRGDFGVGHTTRPAERAGHRA